MEDVQDILDLGDANCIPLVDEYPAVATKMETDPPARSVEFEDMLLEVPNHKVEVLIEKKADLEPEEPILPHHYYDDGNIPVFKPVPPPCSDTPG